MKKLLLVAVIGLTTGWACAGVKTFINATDLELLVKLYDSNYEDHSVIIQSGRKGIIKYPTVDAKKVVADAIKDGKVLRGPEEVWGFLEPSAESMFSSKSGDTLNSNREFKIEKTDPAKELSNATRLMKLQIIPTRR